MVQETANDLCPALRPRGLKPNAVDLTNAVPAGRQIVARYVSAGFEDTRPHRDRVPEGRQTSGRRTAWANIPEPVTVKWNRCLFGAEICRPSGTSCLSSDASTRDLRPWLLSFVPPGLFGDSVDRSVHAYSECQKSFPIHRQRRAGINPAPTQYGPRCTARGLSPPAGFSERTCWQPVYAQQSFRSEAVPKCNQAGAPCPSGRCSGGRPGQ